VGRAWSRCRKNAWRIYEASQMFKRAPFELYGPISKEHPQQKYARAGGPRAKREPSAEALGYSVTIPSPSGAAPPFSHRRVPRLRRSISILEYPALPRWAHVWYRPSGPWGTLTR
jgi:hypothetical protein